MHDPVWIRVFPWGACRGGSLPRFCWLRWRWLTAKGGKQHKRWGMVYLWAMGVVAATALPMALYRPVLFLALGGGVQLLCGVSRGIGF